MNGKISTSNITVSVANCDDPDNIDSFINGNHDGDITTEGAVWTFTCDTGHSRSGPESITCGSDGQWSGTAPECSKHFVYFCYENNH